MANIKHTNQPNKEISLNQLKDQTITVAHDFKEFLTRSHAVDLASALVMGAAVTAIINSIVNDLVMPCIGVLFGTNIKNLVLTIGPAQIAYGSFIQAAFNFIVIAWVIFLLVRAVTRVRKKLDEIDPKSGR